MTEEERWKKAEDLAQALRDVDGNEVKKVFAYLVRCRNMNQLHQLVNQLPNCTMARRSGRTRGYYQTIRQAVNQHLPANTMAEDALWILGWAVRLLKYEATQGSGTARSG